MRRVTPMIHVPDVRAAVDWYRDVGFDVDAVYDDGCDEVVFAVVSFGSGRVMLDSGGSASSAHRREVDLYADVDDVQALYERLKDRVDLVQPVTDTYYGAREFIIRDLNGFWITFGQPSPG